MIATTPGCCVPLENRLVPTLVSILEAEGDKVSSGLQSVALDILQTLVRAYQIQEGSNHGLNKETQRRPLTQLLVAQAFPAAVRCTLHSDDNSVTQVCNPFYPNLFGVLELERASCARYKKCARCESCEKREICAKVLV